MTVLTRHNPAVRLLGKVHGRAVYGRRIATLARHIAAMISPGGRVPDIGCGDGLLDAELGDAVSSLDVRGVEILPRRVAPSRASASMGCIWTVRWIVAYWWTCSTIRPILCR
jgi:2-polyprenyl-3-methyl-5-hydroxy-6-metoxy-1,4-benzoquinol methylase